MASGTEEKTLGQILIGDFNVTGDDVIGRIKELATKLIDAISWVNIPSPLENNTEERDGVITSLHTHLSQIIEHEIPCDRYGVQESALRELAGVPELVLGTSKEECECQKSACMLVLKAQMLAVKAIFVDKGV